MTVAVAVASVAPAGPEGKHGSYVNAGEESHRHETMAAVAAAAAACHHRETSVAAAAAVAACHRREASVAAAAAAAACHRRVILYRRPFVGLSASHGPPVPKTTADDKSMGVRGFRRRTHRRPLFRNFVGLALGVG